MTVARNIQTPLSYPPGTSDGFIRAMEELIIAANGGVEGEDVITDVNNQLNDPASVLAQWIARLDTNGQSTVASALSDAGILAFINSVAAAANTMLYFTSASAADVTALTAFARTLLAAASAASAATVLGLGTGNDVQFSTANVGTGGFKVSGTKVVGVQESAIASLTNSTGGSADGTLALVGDTSAGDESGPINDNFTELTDKLDAILAILRPTGHGLIAV